MRPFFLTSVLLFAGMITSEATAQCPGGVCPMPQQSSASQQSSSVSQPASSRSSRRPARRLFSRIFRGR